MKPFAKGLACTYLFLIVGASHALAEDGFNKKTWFAGLHYYAYDEPGVMTEKSRLPSLTVGYQNLDALWEDSSQNFLESPKLAGVAEATIGLTKYDGSGTVNTSYTKFLGEVYLPVVGDFYAGVGYRSLTDNLGGLTTTTGASGYDRLSQYFYIPLGITFAGNDGRFKAQYNFFVSGKQDSYLSDTGYYLDMSNDQKSGSGLDLSYTPNSGQFQVYFRYWSIGKSEVSNLYYTNGSLYGTGWEPKNNTLELGYRLSF